MNRDDPSATGDWEITDNLTNPAKPCNIYYVQARRVGIPSIVYNSADEIKSNLNQVVRFVVNRYKALQVGMVCINTENTATGGCFNYEIRFCCGK